MDDEIDTMTKNYEQQVNKKDSEIEDLKKKIEEMSQEFAKMLRVKTIIFLSFFIFSNKKGNSRQDARAYRDGAVGRLRPEHDEKAKRYDKPQLMTVCV